MRSQQTKASFSSCPTNCRATGCSMAAGASRTWRSPCPRVAKQGCRSCATLPRRWMPADGCRPSLPEPACVAQRAPSKTHQSFHEKSRMKILNLFGRRAALAGLLAAVAALLPLHVCAQEFPNKPIKVVVGYSAGGAVDIVARTLVQSMSASMGQPFVVDNKPGAGTNIAVKSVIEAAADGYTLLMAANALAANMALYQPPPFDAERELVPVALIGRVPVVIAANPGAPYSSVAQLIQAAKAKPGSIA